MTNAVCRLAMLLAIYSVIDSEQPEEQSAVANKIAVASWRFRSTCEGDLH